jgi:uncharacterized membrane protein YecN with MAPEG domain
MADITTLGVGLITTLYAGILGVMAIGIAVAVGRTRASSGISIGDGSNVELIVAMRRHANFIEFVPMTLIVIGLLELSGVGSTVIHVLGGGLVVARLSHAIGFRTDESLQILRSIGAVGSVLILLVASIWAITLAF